MLAPFWAQPAVSEAGVLLLKREGVSFVGASSRSSFSCASPPRSAVAAPLVDTTVAGRPRVGLRGRCTAAHRGDDHLHHASLTFP
jgi:hypothetical protein